LVRVGWILEDVGVDCGGTRQSEVLAGDGSSAGGLVELGSFIPAASRCVGVVADGLIREEREELVVNDGAAQAAADLVEAGIVALGIVVGVPALISV